MRKIIVILVFWASVLPTMVAQTFGPLANPIATDPVPQLQSTSSMLGSSRGSAKVSYAQPAQYNRFSQSAAPVMNWKPLYTTSSHKKGTMSGGMSGESGSFSAVTISRDNFNKSMEAANSGGSGPRRVGPIGGGGSGGSGVLPPDPFWGEVAPIGDTPWLIILLLGVGYIAYVAYKRRKASK